MTGTESKLSLRKPQGDLMELTVVEFSKNPFQRNLTRRAIELLCEGFELVSQYKVSWKVLFGEAREAQSQVTGLQV